ncbi:MAG: Smr/MutS family protein [Rickettsiales bacterium]|mgnify:CR=1 FL=1|jgi:DNA-nicking Smr family endonuclease|nr:Smr/MutS family protein [Rickettsiales bacterium]
MANNDDIWQQYTKGEIRIEDPDGKDNSEQEDIIDLVLDLHCYTESEAFEALHSAIKNACSMRIKQMVVITGTNIKNSQKTGILYKEVPRWLEHSKIAKYIKSFSYHKNNEGALLVSLNKNT